MGESLATQQSYQAFGWRFVAKITMLLAFMIAQAFDKAPRRVINIGLLYLLDPMPQKQHHLPIIYSGGEIK